MAARNAHHRANDHTGTAPLSDFVLSADLVGRYPTLPTYPAGMSIADVLNDLVDRLAVVTITQLPQFTADAVLLRTIGNDTAFSYSGTPVYLTIAAAAMIFDPNKAFTASAFIAGRLTANAVIA